MKIIAHRSGPVNFPEQTIDSALEALSFGADIIEIDVRFTADKQLAVSHDLNLKRVFGVDFEVSNLTAAEFTSLERKSAPGYSGHLLSDYMKAGVAPLLIHFKEPDTLDAVLQTIDEYGYAEKTIMGINKVSWVSKIYEHNPKLQILSFANMNLVPDFIEAKIDYIRLWENWLTPETVAQVKRSHSKLWVMSGSSEGKPPVGEPTDEGIQQILAYEPDGVLINDVRRLV